MLLGDLFDPHELQLIWAVILGVFGLIWGSFFNVCIYRLPAGLSVVTPRSYCYSCGTMVRAIDNIPVLSYLMLRGACRHCGAPFSPRYAAIELLSGALFAAVGWHLGGAGLTPGLLLYVGYTGVLIVATFTDIDHYMIPDSMSVWAGVAVIALTAGIGALALAGVPTGLIAPIATGWPFDQWGPLASQPWWVPIAASAAGAVAGAGSLYLVGFIGAKVFQKEAMGFGDVKLMVGIGAILGVVHTVAAFFVACVVGSVLSLTYMAVQWLRGRKSLPLRERFPAVGGEVEDGRAAEEEDLDLPTETPPGRHGRLFAKAAHGRHPYAYSHLPFGPYLAIGALILLLYHGTLTERVDMYLEIFGVRRRPPMTIVRYREAAQRSEARSGAKPQTGSGRRR